MARPLRKKHQKSSLSRVTQPSSRRRPPTKRLPLTNPLIAAKWDKTLTLAQNYRRLGLSSKLNVRSGGVEKVKRLRKSGHEDGGEGVEVMEEERDPLAFTGGVLGKRKRGGREEAGVEVTKVVRDDEGRIVRIIKDASEGTKRRNPLNDPLNDLESDDPSSPPPSHHIQQHTLRALSSTQDHDPAPTASIALSTNVVPSLEALASTPRLSKPRQQTTSERGWIERLVAKHGDDIAAMVRDRKMNPRQQTAGDIKRRVKIWREERGKEGA